MKDKIIKILLKYGITAAVGGLMAFAVISLHGYADAADSAERCRILADAFTIPGVVLMLCAALVWISNAGMFYGLSYLAGRAVRALFPMGRTFEKHERYADYVLRKREKGGVHGYGFIFHVGAAFFAVAVVFIIRFYGLSE